MSWFAELLGQDVESVAERETDFNPRTGKVKRGLGERAGDWLWRRDADSIGKARQKLETQAVLDSAAYADAERESKKRFAGDINLADVNYSTTAGDLKDRVDASKERRLLANQASRYGATDQQIADAGDDLGAIAELAEAGKTKKEYDNPFRKDERAAAKRQEDRALRIEERGVRNDELARLDLAEDRRQDYLVRLEDLDLRRQQESNKMDIYRQQVANQRADRKQAQMMALIQGLATLGSGFAL